MSEKLMLDYNNFENSLLSKEFDKKGGIKSFSQYISETCHCICQFNDNDNQEEMDDDSWIITFKNKEDISSFCIKYKFSNENGLLIKL